MGTVAEKLTVNTIWTLIARVGEGERRGVRDMGGPGSLVVVVNVNVDKFPLPPPTVAS